MTIKEISKLTGESKPVVKTWVNEAKKRFRVIDELVNKTSDIQKIDFDEKSSFDIICIARWTEKQRMFIQGMIKKLSYEKTTGKDDNRNGCCLCMFSNNYFNGEIVGFSCLHEDNIINDCLECTPRIKENDIYKKWNKDGNCERFKMGTIEAFK